MSAQKMGGLDYFYTYIVPKLTSAGAGIVILGALFKIMHFEGAAEMLMVGMITEAIIFFMGVAEPVHPDVPRPDWSKVYPQLKEGSDVPPLSFPTTSKPAIQQDEKVLSKLALLEAKLAESITPEKIGAFGDGMKAMTDSAAKMAQIADASSATSEYAKNVKLASNQIVEMNKAYATTVTAMSEMSNASKDAKAYHAQVQTLTKNLTELNAVYEVELRSASKHVKSMNEFYGNLAAAMQNVANASKDTEKFKQELGGLTTNLTALNKVYGGMLAAMKA